jgi:hypothetical protein
MRNNTLYHCPFQLYHRSTTKITKHDKLASLILNSKQDFFEKSLMKISAFNNSEKHYNVQK